MGDGPGVSAAAFVGRQIGEWAARQWGTRLRATFDDGKSLSGPLGRALIDAFVMEGLVGIVWPSVVVLALILGCHALAVAMSSMEAERVLTGSAALLAVMWSIVGAVEACMLAWPHLRLWLATRLRPVAHVRLLLFQRLRAIHHDWQASLPDSGYAAVAVREALKTLQAQTGLTPDRAAFALADHLAPLLVRHLASRLGLALAPVVGALAYYRLVIYPDLLEHGPGGGPWSLALYPLAALTDLLFGTSLRAALLAPS
ncbi:MAG: hypothetical protein U1E70_20925 [Acetobacteraceae bacterium]